MSSILTSPVVSCSLDVLADLAKVRLARLHDLDVDESHVYAILTQAQEHGLRSKNRNIVGLWLAHDAQKRPVGMAVVTEERVDHQWFPLINIFVAPEARKSGLGKTLVAHAQRNHHKLQGHYTVDSIGLYQAMGISDFGRHRLPPGPISNRHFNQIHAELHLENARAKAAQEKTINWDISTFPDADIGPGRAHRASARERQRHRR